MTLKADRVADSVAGLAVRASKTRPGSTRNILPPAVHDELKDDEAFERLSKLARYSAFVIPYLIEGKIPELTKAGIVLEITDLPSDLIESPHIRFKSKPDREDPRAEEQTCTEIEIRLKELSTQLDGVIADFKAKRPVDEKKQTVLRSLAALYRDIDVQIRETKSYKNFKDTLRALQIERDATYKMLKDGEKDGADKTRQSRLNLRLLRTLKLLVKAQIMKAGMLLNDRARSRKQTASANAQCSLNSAHDSLEFLKRELNFRAVRLEHAPKIREMIITDAGGEEVWTTNLGNFDIEFSKSKEASTDEEPKVTIRQKKWIVPPTTLVNIRRHVKRGELDEARRKLNLLVGLYSLWRIRMLESSKNVLGDLKDLRKTIAHLPDGTTPDPEIIINVVEKIRNLIGVPGKIEPKISSTPHWVWTKVNCKSLGTGTESQLRILAGNRNDYALIVQNKALIEEYAALLNKAAEKGILSKRRKELIEDGVSRLAVWTGRGFVFPKQFADVDLSSVVNLMNTGFGLENEPDKENDVKQMYLRAAARLAEAARELEPRLTDISRISGNVKARADALYSEFRDDDIKHRATCIVQACKGENYREVLNQTGAIRSRYFAFPLVEPGYIRANGLLGEIETLVQRTSKITNAQAKREKLEMIEGKTNVLVSDIKHKQAFRVHVFSIKAGESRYRYVNPGTTLAGLLSLLHVDPATAFVSLGNGRISNAELRSIKLDDETPTICISKEPPKRSYRPAKKGRVYKVA